MALELKFVKEDNVPWGFRLTGGAEYDVPLIVVKVAENSIAAEGGLQDNDIIVRINDTSTAGLTHAVAHEIFSSSRNQLVLAVRRGDVSDLIPDFPKNLQVSQESLESLESEEVHFELASSVGSAHAVQIEKSAIETEVEVSITHSESVSTEVQDRKWSTFLQRPKNAKPIEKKEAVEKTKGVPYKVVISKQKKKDKKQYDGAQGAIEEITGEITSEERTKTVEVIQETKVSDTQEETIIRAEITEEEEIEMEVAEDENREISEEKVSEIEENGSKEKSEEPSELDSSIEEKLAEVQKQLQALSQLPTTIQQTINAMTQQLASIVAASKPPKEEEPEEQEEQEEQKDDTASEVDEDFTQQIITEESCLSMNEEIEVEEKESEAQEEPAEEEQQEQIMTEEELHIHKIRLARLEKHEKDRIELEELKRQQRQPLKPIDRPIILPGGRRWSQPDDACPVRHPKMSDEKIANTIASHTEVIVGRAKGINFLKYQPPPKNLDYLQKSDVYRLVHDMEPPVRGISSRACKILAEQDYYQSQESV